MEAPLWILLLYSSVGTVDGIYNHLYRYCLYLHGAFIWAVIGNWDQLVHGVGFGTLRWPPLPTFLLSKAVVLVVGGLALFVLRVYLLGVGYRAIKMIPGAPVAEPSRL